MLSFTWIQVFDLCNFPSPWRIYLNISCQAVLLEKNSLSCCLRKSLLLFHFWRIISLGAEFWIHFFFFQHFILFYPLLAGIISDEKAAIFFVYKRSISPSPPLTPFRIFFHFECMCLDADVLVFIVLVDYLDSQICGLVSVIDFEKLSSIIASNIFCAPSFFLFLLLLVYINILYFCNCHMVLGYSFFPYFYIHVSGKFLWTDIQFSKLILYLSVPSLLTRLTKVFFVTVITIFMSFFFNSFFCFH